MLLDLLGSMFPITHPNSTIVSRDHGAQLLLQTKTRHIDEELNFRGGLHVASKVQIATMATIILWLAGSLALGGKVKQVINLPYIDISRILTVVLRMLTYSSLARFIIIISRSEFKVFVLIFRCFFFSTCSESAFFECNSKSIRFTER